MCMAHAASVTRLALDCRSRDSNNTGEVDMRHLYSGLYTSISPKVHYLTPYDVRNPAGSSRCRLR
ncbi:hypothetical protein DOTSEDRAFT_75956 [Dothistroma septosporum NZE10]|uniref:Uncharacterized protein n=1 Tax=Dothistroma septosporum (strain NZE10 / CBS 128990) TaxID=675120 RepID=M2WHG8_DOTSN|nr:hypothetical protein DOTSEDRAFT_75956 [Dothistroma septosporum NZE10]